MSGQPHIWDSGRLTYIPTIKFNANGGNNMLFIARLASGFDISGILEQYASRGLADARENVSLL